MPEGLFFVPRKLPRTAPKVPRKPAQDSSRKQPQGTAKTPQTVAVQGVSVGGRYRTRTCDLPHVRRIVLCLDADGPGRDAAGELGEKYRGLGYVTEERAPPSGKDWNQYLQMENSKRRQT